LAAYRVTTIMKTLALLVLLGSFLTGNPLGAAVPGWGRAAPATQDGRTTTVWDGVYSEAQARRGEQVFKTACSYCHKEDLSGGFIDDGIGRAPALAGKRAFDSSLVERWGGLTLADMVATVVATMPQQRPATLSVENYVDVVSYLLFKNDARSGPSDLPTDVEALSRIIVPKK
jgi:cytochrome c